MRVLVAGATGNTGLRLVKKLTAAGHAPIALVRESSDTSDLDSEVEIRHGDLTDLQSGVCAGADVVIFAAGSGGSTSDEMTDKVDRDGAKKLIDLAAEAGVSRFVMLSSRGAGDPDPDSKLAHYLKAKHEADEHLKASGLNYVIVRPVSLTDDEGTGNIRLGDDVDLKGTAARGDVAAVLTRAVDEAAWSDQTFLMDSM